MARKTTLQEVEIHLTRFFKETKGELMDQVVKTKQPTRREHMLAMLDAFDKVEGKYYDWLNAQQVNP